jgi:hypothetical protein
MEWNYDACAAVLEKEFAIIEQAASVQESVRGAVIDREWADFDWKMAKIGQLSEELGQLEEERAALFKGLGISDDDEQVGATFYGKLAAVPEELLSAEQRRRLSDLYRRLKNESLKLRAENESFLAYVRHERDMAMSYVRLTYPERSNKLYTRRGREVKQHNSASMILNRSV